MSFLYIKHILFSLCTKSINVSLTACFHCELAIKNLVSKVKLLPLKVKVLQLSSFHVKEKLSEQLLETKFIFIITIKMCGYKHRLYYFN